MDINRLYSDLVYIYRFISPRIVNNHIQWIVTMSSLRSPPCWVRIWFNPLCMFQSIPLCATILICIKNHLYKIFFCTRCYFPPTSHFQRLLFGSKSSDSRMTEFLLELLAAVELYDVVAINAEPSSLANIYSKSLTDCHAATVPLPILSLSLCNASPVICYPRLVAYNGEVIPECLVQQFYRVCNHMLVRITMLLDIFSICGLAQAHVDPDVMNLIMRGTYWSVIRLPDSVVSHKAWIWHF